MPWAKVKDGCTYGAHREHAAGDVLDVTAQELASFADKLEPASAPRKTRKRSRSSAQSSSSGLAELDVDAAAAGESD